MTTTSYDLSTTTTSTRTAGSLDRVIGLGAIIGPLLAVASTVAWAADAAEPRAILQFWAFVGFALAFVGISRRLEPASTATAVLVLGLVGCSGGVAFAAELAMVDHFGVERLNDQNTVATILMLQMPGICFPLSLLGAAFALWRSRVIAPLQAGLLAIGAVCFPASRIPEVPELAIVADALVVAAVAPLGWAMARAGRT